MVQVADLSAKVASNSPKVTEWRKLERERCYRKISEKVNVGLDVFSYFPQTALAVGALAVLVKEGATKCLHARLRSPVVQIASVFIVNESVLQNTFGKSIF